MFAITASAQLSWDFTVVPTQSVDGTGNLEGNDPTVNNNGVVPTDPTQYGQLQVIQDKLTEGSELTVKEGEPLEMTKGLTFGSCQGQPIAGKAVLFRNYPAEAGGAHLYIFHTITMYVPAFKGDKVTFVCAATKDRYIRCETATETEKKVPRSSDGTGVDTVSFTLTEDAPAFEFYDNPSGSYRDMNMYIRSITITPNPERPTAWNFTTVPTQSVDGTGNLEGNDPTVNNNGVVPADPTQYGQLQVIQDKLEEGSELTVKADEPLEMTKYLTFGSCQGQPIAGKAVLFRNYPEAAGGAHLYIFHTIAMYVPAYKGDQVTFVCAATKDRYIRCETATETEIKVPRSSDGTGVDKVTFTLTENAPVFEFYDNPSGSYRDMNMYIRSITIGSTDGISEISATGKSKMDDNRIYNIMGQRISQPVKGQVYIMNGHKYLAK